jgi:hypothetical protein
MEHEFVIAKSATGALPVDADGAADESQIPEADFVGELEDMGRGDQATLDTALTPGTYVLFCNVVHTHGSVTERHYAEGMRTTFTVR